MNQISYLHSEHDSLRLRAYQFIKRVVPCTVGFGPMWEDSVVDNLKSCVRNRRNGGEVLRKEKVDVSLEVGDFLHRINRY